MLPLDVNNPDFVSAVYFAVLILVFVAGWFTGKWINRLKNGVADGPYSVNMYGPVFITDPFTLETTYFDPLSEDEDDRHE